MDFELCIDSVKEALVAKQMGLKRVELCSGLEVGGLTPSYGLISSCVEVGDVEVHVMIRPNGGSFVYSDEDFQIMQKDILGAGTAKAAGVVFGVLTKDNRLDYQKNAGMVHFAKTQNLECTFHRAIDLSSNWELDLEDLIEIGFDRVLTSGGASKAIDGIDQIAKMKKQAAGRIEIMAGSGVNPNNALMLSKVKVDALHFTARKTIDKNDDFSFGTDIEVDQTKIEEILKHF
jgi:copper homeostasis protein